VLDLDLQIVVPDLRAHTQFLDLTAFVLFARFFELLLALVSKFRKIRQFAYRRIILGCDLYQV